jgi:hypothetical protein
VKAFVQCALALALLTISTAASAQTRVRVTREQATIWRAGFSVVATVVSRGTELEAVARRGTWYEVVIPSGGGPVMTGFVAVAQVERISGPEPPDRPLGAAGAPNQRPPTTSPPGARASTAGKPAVGVRAFGLFGVQWYTAHDTFDAVFGKSRGYQFGGGVEVQYGSWFVQGAIERFSRTGQRVFVFDGDVFGLGLDDKVTITPIQATVGYRLFRRAVNPYVGGGIGRVLLKETSAFAQSSDDVDEGFTSYHALAGLQWRAASGWWGTAFEVQYTHVPNALKDGVADLLGEHNLGGIEARVKLEIGR